MEGEILTSVVTFSEQKCSDPAGTELTLYLLETLHIELPNLPNGYLIGCLSLAI